MRKYVVIKHNPSKQKKDEKIFEISFIDSKGGHKSCLIFLGFANDIPVIDIYKVDKGINIRIPGEQL